MKSILMVAMFAALPAWALTSAQQQTIKMYSAEVGRAPNLYEVADAPSPKVLLQTADGQELYPNSATNREFVLTAYKVLVNRTPGDVEQRYWLLQLRRDDRATVTLRVLDDTLRLKDGAPGKAALQNKLAFAYWVTDWEIQLNRDVNPRLLRSVQGKVTADAATVGQAKDTIIASTAPFQQGTKLCPGLVLAQKAADATCN